SSMVQIWLGTLISKHVLKMVCPKRTAVLPLRVAGAISLANGNPAVPTHRLPWARVGLLKPGNHEWRFRFELTMRDIVVRQRAIEWILVRYKRYGNIIPPGRRIGIIKATVTVGPIRVPGTSVVGNWIITPGFFTNPKHRRYDIRLP